MLLMYYVFKQTLSCDSNFAKNITFQGSRYAKNYEQS